MLALALLTGCDHNTVTEVDDMFCHTLEVDPDPAVRETPVDPPDDPPDPPGDDEGTDEDGDEGHDEGHDEGGD